MRVQIPLITFTFQNDMEQNADTMKLGNHQPETPSVKLQGSLLYHQRGRRRNACLQKRTQLCHYARRPKLRGKPLPFRISSSRSTPVRIQPISGATSCFPRRFGSKRARTPNNDRGVNCCQTSLENIERGDFSSETRRL